MNWKKRALGPAEKQWVASTRKQQVMAAPGQWGDCGSQWWIIHCRESRERAAQEGRLLAWLEYFTL